MKVAYLTDVEGSWQKLASFVNACDGVSFDGASGGIVVDDGFVFVFGGDAVDRGPWSRKVCQALLDVKLRQPERVVLLGGNRDINKLRLPRELEGAVPKKAGPEVAALFRDQKPELLKWIFSNTMGAQPAFEHRRSELLAGGAAHGDDDVVNSFVADLLPPSGLHYRYLAQTQLAFRLGQTLYVHGGVADECLGKVPGEEGDAADAYVDDVDGWITALNAFYQRQLARYGERPIVVDQEPLWLPVILYQAPKKGLGRNPGSVVYGRFGNDAWNNPRLPSPSSLRWLATRGIRRVVVGHTPCGDLPAVLRPPKEWNADVEIVVADNSRGRLDHGNAIVVSDGALDVKAKTSLDDGRVSDVAYVLGRDDDSDVGSVTADGCLVKAVVSDVAYVMRFDAGWALHQVQRPRATLGPLSPPIDVASPVDGVDNVSS